MQTVKNFTFRIGNPNFATFSGFKLKAKWGARAPRYPQDAQIRNANTWQIDFAAWEKSLHEKEIESAIELKPGVWNTVEVVLSPAKPEELAYLELSMLTDKVALYQPIGASRSQR